MSDYTIILADDHTLFRQGIRKLIESIEGLKVIAEANDGHQLLALLKKKVPDLAILDISMPGIRSIEAAKEIHRLYPQVRILMLSMHKSREFLSLALQTGANGYLLKEDSGDELMQAIDQIRSGRTYLSATLAKHCSTDIIDICRGTARKVPDTLTHREREILKLIAEGRTDRQISSLLFISLRTVQRHRYNIRTKLNLKHTADLVRHAIAKGYI